MRTLHQRLNDHERKLRELIEPGNGTDMTPEVRAILIETCKAAIAQLQEEIEEEGVLDAEDNRAPTCPQQQD